MKQLPTVSIQIPTYNQQRLLVQAIESAMMQDYPRLEIVIADDCSTDQTRETVTPYLADKRIRYFRNEPNIGRVPNYRKALYEYCRAEWAVNLDGDDYFTDPGHISEGIRQILEAKAKGRNVVFYQACEKAIDEGTGVAITFSHGLLKGEPGKLLGREYFLNYADNKFLGHFSTIYNRELAMKVGFYEHDSLIADTESLLKLALHGDVILDNKVVGVWRIHSSNESNTVLRSDKQQQTLQVYQRMLRYAMPILGETIASQWYKKMFGSYARSYLYEYERSGCKGLFGQIRRLKYYNGYSIKLMLKSFLRKLHLIGR